MRIGTGFDVHKLVSGRRLILGGVDIPHKTGLLGHSDADVLLHAIMDALLGAMALGDIGKHFPDSDPKYKDANSLQLLKEVYIMLNNHGCKVVNIDSTIAAQRPKLAPFIADMRQNIANCLQVDITQISVKATTTEGLGFVGEEQGMSASAVCLIEEKN